MGFFSIFGGNMFSRMRSLAAASALALAGALASNAGAAVVYDNGPTSGNTDGFTIDGGFAVSNSFTLSGTTTITGVDFVTWDYPASTVLTVDYGIGSEPQGFLDEATATVTATDLGANQYGFELYSNHIDLAGDTRRAGTYYLTLQGATTSTGDDVFWDQNDGPSNAYSDFYGDLSIAGPNDGLPCTGACTYSETFDIVAAGVPEPATWAMMLVGVGAMGAALRSRRRVSAATA
jgi:hypothetical protein